MVNEMINDKGDDRANILANEKLLIVEDDLRFGKILIERAHQHGLKAIVAVSYTEVLIYQPVFTHCDYVDVIGYQRWKVLSLRNIKLLAYPYLRNFRRGE
jgi:hypothetical protein